MSELQAALLAIGLGVIVAVYTYGWWQQREYRRKFGTAFKGGHADALYQEKKSDKSFRLRDPELADIVGQVVDTPDADVQNTNLLDESCKLLDVQTDFIFELHLEEPGSAAMLDGLWQRKFDFGKPVQVCGLSFTTNHWERALAESQTLYSRFRIALQLVDRSGAISEAKLADFSDLVMGLASRIKASTGVQDINKAHQRANELDAFCAEVDQMVGVNLLPHGERLLTGAMIAQAAGAHGMTLESDGAFHMLDHNGHTLFSLSNRDNWPFQHLTLETFTTPGITLLLDVPRVENPVAHFDQMVKVAHELAKDLQVNVVDDHHMDLTESGLARIRAQIADVESRMSAKDIAPGSAQARRLFS